MIISNTIRRYTVLLLLLCGATQSSCRPRPNRRSDNDSTEMSPKINYPRIANSEDLTKYLGMFVMIEGTLSLSFSKDESVILTNKDILKDSIHLASFDKQRHKDLFDKRVTLIGKISKIPACDPTVQGRGEHYILEDATLQDGTRIFLKDSQNPPDPDPFGP